ncbi:MAG TPA: hypothetical protein VFZ65_20515 [Planctomycetota bacterium]|nr:hypothetical protein [Planctomycetota bacterium]
MQRPARHRRRIVLAGVLGSTALLLTSFAFVQLRAAASWAEMTARGEVLRREWQAQPRQRPPLSGEAAPGRAFEHYEAAATASEVFAADNYAALRKLLPHSRELDASAGALRTRWRPVLEALRAGAHATDTCAVARADAPAEEHIVNLLTYRWVANIAVFEARALRGEGHDVESVRRTLDAATLGVDLVHDGLLINQMIGAALIAIATSEAWPEPALATLSPPALEELARGLAALDACLPERIAMAREMLFMAENLQQVPDQRAWCGGGTWRYGFSSRWMLADAFLQTEASQARLAAAPMSSWSDRQRQLARQEEVLAASGNPVATMMLPSLVAAEQSLREVLAMLRLLRLSVDLHRGRDVAALPDPLGDGALLVEEHGDARIVRSAGSNERRRFERLVAR